MYSIDKTFATTEENTAVVHFSGVTAM